MNFKKIIQVFILTLLFPFIHFGQIESFDYRPEKVRKKIRKIAQKIAKKDGIDSDAIGYAGERTEQYNRFIQLIENANTEELVELTKHPVSSVRGYSFWGLAKLHYNNLEAIFIKHANDYENVFFIEGCSPMDISVIGFMQQVVNPNSLDINCKKLNNSAFIKMKLAQKKLREKK